MVRQHHQLNVHKFEQTSGDSKGQESPVCCSPWGCKELDKAQRLNNNKARRREFGHTELKHHCMYLDIHGRHKTREKKKKLALQIGVIFAVCYEETEVQRGNLWKDKQLEGGRARNESHSVLLKELHTLPMSGQLIRTCPGLLLCLRSRGCIGFFLTGARSCLLYLQPLGSWLLLVLPSLRRNEVQVPNKSLTVKHFWNTICL